MEKLDKKIKEPKALAPERGGRRGVMFADKIDDAQHGKLGETYRITTYHVFNHLTVRHILLSMRSRI